MAGMGEAGGLKVNQRVKLLRKELKLSQSEFAKLVSVSSTLIHFIETDKRPVNDRLIRLIGDSFDVNSLWLKTGEGTIYNSERGVRVTKLLALFDKLKPRYQEFVLNQVGEFLKLQDDEDGR